MVAFRSAKVAQLSRSERRLLSHGQLDSQVFKAQEATVAGECGSGIVSLVNCYDRLEAFNYDSVPAGERTRYHGHRTPCHRSNRPSSRTSSP